ncbi:MAG TPA: hypothetical protein DDW53_08830 [Lachnoclostridium sp.]|nr:hypothetical protein [Lachnoclostridium sp.]
MDKIKIDKFLDNQGKITQLPQKQSIRAATLCYLAEKFESNRNYTEKEVNSICEAWHTFGDYFILRRELIDYGLLCREPDGSRYWKPKNDLPNRTDKELRLNTPFISLILITGIGNNISIILRKCYLPDFPLVWKQTLPTPII